ncbi:MAG: carbon starvation protein A [Odoribacteraceae bacterium]|jgi:carbon starvation protein CstA|nr:carbon starvation protein A [Odoribacteraceae bacterium]
MITFILFITLLIAAYFACGRFTEKFFGVDPTRPTPVQRLADGVDYQPLKPWRVFVIQFLNIAGLGPIFGAILGAAYGPAAYLWILLGCILAGAVHDFFSGMLSLRHDGMSLPDIVGKYLGRHARGIMTVFTALLLIAVGVSFVNGPAELLGKLTGTGAVWWLYIIFAYYILATLLPINKIIGKIYPFMGAALIFMALGIGGYLLVGGLTGDLHLPELTLASLANMHHQPETNILFPMMFIVISCGAISGFHATQSPMMARCITSERHARPVFYGAMIAEGIVAMIWATAAMTFFGGPAELNAAATAGNTPAVIVNAICNTWLGGVGAVIAIIGVVVCPITSGDTAFRGMRLIIADALSFNQRPMKNRIIISAPVFVIAYLLCQFDFSTIWKYVGISNQVLATITLWTASAYLVKVRKPHWMTSLPATFLTVVCVTYLLVAPNKDGGLSLPHAIAYPAGIIAGITLLTLFLVAKNREHHQTPAP